MPLHSRQGASFDKTLCEIEALLCSSGTRTHKDAGHEPKILLSFGTENGSGSLRATLSFKLVQYLGPVIDRLASNVSFDLWTIEQKAIQL